MSDNPTKNQDNPGEEKTPPQPEKLLAGKYRSVEDLEKGYWELSKEGLKQRDAKVRAEAERDTLLQQVQQMSPKAGKDPLADALAEAEIPLEALDARVEAKALGILQNVLKPVMQQQTAEQRMVELHDDWPGTNEILKALKPEAAESYKKLLSTAPEEAMQLGYEAWTHARSSKSAVDESSKRAASPPPKRSGGGTAEDEGQFDKERYRALLQEAIQTGDWTKFGRYRFGEQKWFKHLADGDEW